MPKEWSRWGSLNKATFIAQLLAPIALLATVVFGFLSWREAHLAFELQKRLFVAQSAPRLEVSAVTFTTDVASEPVMVITLKNTGESDALHACFVTLEFNSNKLGGTCAPSDTVGGWNIRRDASFTYLIPIRKILGQPFGFAPIDGTVEHIDQSKRTCKGKSGAFFVLYRYGDALGELHSGLDQLSLCDQHMTPSP